MHYFCRGQQLRNLAKIARALRRIYTRRHRPRAFIPILLIIVLTAAVGVLGYFKVSLIPKTPVPPLVD
jgi:fatty acid desaturase